MTIICLGWGSLIWRRENLPVIEPWHEDGPSLPVEFARQSDNGRITLVVVPREVVVRVLWAEIRVASLGEARRVLSEREGPGVNLGRVAHWSRSDSSQRPETEIVQTWALQRAGIEAVVWTALGPRFQGVNARIPTEAEVVEYLGNLAGQNAVDAENYIRRAPIQIRTPYRDAIERALGWTPVPPTGIAVGSHEI